MKQYQLNLLQAQAEKCQECDLHKNRGKLVFAKGNPDAEILMIGEAPGAQEAEQGIPFIGKSGQLLDNMIAAMGMKTEDIFITNACNCRPPANRKPTQEEIKTCNKFISKKIDIVKPKIIITLGITAAQSLGIMDEKETLKSKRGVIHKYSNISVISTYHPSALLRDPSKKLLVRDDLKLALDHLKSLKEV